MTDPGWSSTHLLAELKRRHVFRVFAVYCAVAFVLLQIMDLVVPALLLPDWTYRLVAFILALGLPIVLITAWAFEITPDGVKRTETLEGRSPVGDSMGSSSHARGLTVPMAVVLLLAAGWWIGRQSTSFAEPGSASPAATGLSVTKDAPHESRVSVAVLPFVNMSSDAEQEFFSDGISEELLNLLARISALRVTARTSSFAFKGQDLTAVEIGDTLNVSYLVEGSVRKDGDLIRVTAQLIETEDGSHLWSETWDRRLDDIFVVQDEIAADVAAQLHLTLIGDAPAVEATEPAAYDLVLQARNLAEEGTPTALRKAEDLFRRALAIDPDYAAGWTALARFYSSPAYLASQATFESSFARAAAAAERSLALDPEHAPAHRVLSRLAAARGDLASAAHHAARALELAPGDAESMRGAAGILGSLGRLEEAVDLLEQVIVQDPLSRGSYWGLSRAYLTVGRTADAVAMARKATSLNPEATGVWSNLAVALMYDGSPESGLSAARREVLDVWRMLALAQVLYALGREAESDAIIVELIDEHERGWAFNIAYVMAYRGDVDRAFEWLDRAVAYEDPGLAEVFWHPQFASLHDDPRWPVFLDRLGKSPERLASIDFSVTLPGG